MQCSQKPLPDTDKIDHKSAVLARISPVHTGNCLDDRMILRDGFVDVDTVQKRHIKACQPEVYHNGDLEITVNIFELDRRVFPHGIRTEQFIHFNRIIL